MRAVWADGEGAFWMASRAACWCCSSMTGAGMEKLAKVPMRPGRRKQVSKKPMREGLGMGRGWRGFLAGSNGLSGFG